MLALRPQIKVFSRPIERKGDFVLTAYYVVAQYADGRVEVLKTVYKTVRATAIAGLLSAGQAAGKAAEAVKDIVLALPGRIARGIFAFVKSFGGRTISTYTKDLSFFTAQPIRGPSL